MTAKKTASVKEVMKTKTKAAETAAKKPEPKAAKGGGKPVKGVPPATPVAKPARNVLREIYKNISAATNKALSTD